METDRICRFPNSRVLEVTLKGRVLIFVGGMVQRPVWFHQSMILPDSNIWTGPGTLLISESTAMRKNLIPTFTRRIPRQRRRRPRQPRTRQPPSPQ